MIRITCVAAAIAVKSAVSTASAADRPFGTPGDIVLTNGLGLSLSHSILEPAGAAAGSRHSVVQVHPNLDAFVLPGLSLGGGPSYAHAWWRYENSGGAARYRGSDDSLGIAFRVGYALNLGDRVTLWPGAAVWYSRLWSRSNVPVAPGDDRMARGGVGGDLLGLFHVTPSFFVGFGPRVTRDVYEFGGAQARSTTLQANSFVGGRL
jgi:hypothetical protein